MKTIIGLLLINTLFLSTSFSTYTTHSAQDSISNLMVSQLESDKEETVNDDSSYTFINANKNIKYCNYIPIISALIGSFFASLIALVAIYLTHKKNKEIETRRESEAKRKQDNQYNSLLFGVYSEIKANDKILTIIKGEMDAYLDTVKTKDKLIATDVFNTLKLNFIEQCRTKMVDNENFSLKVLEVVSRYINKTQSINDSLKSNKILQIKNFILEGESLFDTMKEYFNAVLNLINDLEEGSIYLKETIMVDHNSFENIDIRFTDIPQSESK